MLAAGGWPLTSENTLFLQEWHSYEESKCNANPINTTLKLTGSKDCVQTGTPGVAVQAYSGSVQGTKATVATLQARTYINITAALNTGNPFTYPAPNLVAQELRTWGSTTFATAYLSQVGVTAPAPPPPVPGTSGSAGAATGVRDAHILSGWHDLGNSVDKHLARQLFKSRHMGAATLRALAVRHKVKG